MFHRKRGHGVVCRRRSPNTTCIFLLTAYRRVDNAAEIPSIRPAFNLPTIPLRSRLVSMTQALRPACVIHRALRRDVRRVQVRRPLRVGVVSRYRDQMKLARKSGALSTALPPPPSPPVPPRNSQGEMRSRHDDKIYFRPDRGSWSLRVLASK